MTELEWSRRYFHCTFSSKCTG